MSPVFSVIRIVTSKIFISKVIISIVVVSTQHNEIKPKGTQYNTQF